MEGWIKLHRCLLSKAIWKCSNNDQRAILVTILLLANHEANQWMWKGDKYTCQPGEFITSYRSLAEKTDTSVQTVRTALAKFKKMEFLTYEVTHQATRINVVNWGFYQNTNTPTNTPTNTDVTQAQHSGNTDLTTNKNEKNVKNDKNVKSNNKLSCDDSHRVVEEFGFNAIVQSSVDKWIDYKYERKDSYTPTGLNTLLGQIQKKVDLEGTDFVTDAIDNSISNTWKGIIWDAIKNNKRTVQSNKQVTGNQFVAYMMRGEDI